MELGQLFCKHLWKDEKEELLGRVEIIHFAGACVDDDFYLSYAIHQKCVKCGKKRITESNVLSN